MADRKDWQDLQRLVYLARETNRALALKLGVVFPRHLIDALAPRLLACKPLSRVSGVLDYFAPLNTFYMNDGAEAFARRHVEACLADPSETLPEGFKTPEDQRRLRSGG